MHHRRVSGISNCLMPVLQVLQFWQQIEGILPKGPYLPCVSMAGRALLAGYHRNMGIISFKVTQAFSNTSSLVIWYFRKWPMRSGQTLQQFQCWYDHELNMCTPFYYLGLTSILSWILCVIPEGHSKLMSVDISNLIPAILQPSTLHLMNCNGRPEDDCS